jgi:hypothetical protein
LGTVLEETPGVRRFQAIKTKPETLSVRLEVMLGADDKRVWEAVDRRLREYLFNQGLPSVDVETNPRAPGPNPVSGKYRQVWAEV